MNLLFLGQSVKKANGKEIFLPSDFVYYSDQIEKHQGKYYQIFKNQKYPKIYWSTSSGVAAHLNFDSAQEHATFELIERDAIMRTWLAKDPPEIISDSLLCQHIINRKQFWSKKGRKTINLLLNSKYSYVVNTIIVSDTYPYFVSGAAAGFNLDQCIMKSYDEAEFSLTSLIYNPEAEMSPNDVITPGDHGRLYSHKKYLNTLEWLWNGKEITKIPHFNKNFEKLKNSLDLITVDLSDEKIPLKVVRVLSNKLIPISFGSSSECFLHSTILSNNHTTSLPHYFS
ncbi:YcaO-like family protein [Lactococcus fujiensis]|uniref:YcaO-like family protein n=1 Tax=Lactococcus fujiensis TaxID=610251 RepID=UPI000B2619E2|nr:YcaO-like family protein [Lactococcus fujiensis]